MANTKPRTLIERRKGERTDAYAALCDYARMGAGRSLKALHARYEDEAGTSSDTEPPTTNYSTLRNWSSRNDWAERVEEYDEDVQRLLQEEEERALKEGLASAGRRVIELTDLYEDLKEEYEDGAKWLDDVKGIGSSEHGTYEKVEIRRFNSALVKRILDILDDIANEVGDRKHRMDVTTGDEQIDGFELEVVHTEAEEFEQERRAAEEYPQAKTNGHAGR